MVVSGKGGGAERIDPTQINSRSTFTMSSDNLGILDMISVVDQLNGYDSFVEAL